MNRIGRIVALALVILVGGAVTALAGPILDAGWYYDDITAVHPVPSTGSPYVYSLAGPAVFTVTDDFAMGDTFAVTDFGAPLTLTESWDAMTPFDASDPNGWLTAGYFKGQVLLGAGAHELVVTGLGQGGVPAGFYTRLDSAGDVPEPSTFALFGLGGAALVFLRRKASR